MERLYSLFQMLEVNIGDRIVSTSFFYAIPLDDNKKRLSSILLVRQTLSTGPIWT